MALLEPSKHKVSVGPLLLNEHMEHEHIWTFFEKVKITFFYLICLTLVIQINCFCPNCCVYDDDKLETICFNTDLDVRINNS
jgi:hypothetical protein